MLAQPAPLSDQKNQPMQKEALFILLSLLIFFRSSQPARADLKTVAIVAAGIGIGFLAEKFNPTPV